MTTLTSGGAVNLTSSTNWSPAQTPVAGDDLVIGAHTLTLDADFTGANALLSIQFTSASSRLAVSGATRVVDFANGISWTVAITGPLCSTAITVGMSLTIRGKWQPTGNFNMSAMFTSTGGNLTLATIGDDPSTILMDDHTGNGARVITASWTAGTLTTIGRLYTPNASNASTLVTMAGAGGGAGAYWNHTHTGLSEMNLGGVGHQLLIFTGKGAHTWSGDLTSGSTSATGGLWNLSNNEASSITGTILRTRGNAINAFYIANGSSVVHCLGAFNAALTLTGKFYSTNKAVFAVVNSATAATGRVNWRNQAVSIASNESIIIAAGAGCLVDLTNFQVTNAGRFAYLETGAATCTTDSDTLVTCTTAALAFDNSGTGAFDGKIIVLESDPPTLPDLEDVAAGTVYGYDESPLTGTGLIMDPAVLAAAMHTAVDDELALAVSPYRLVETTIATLASQTSFTLTAGSADDDAYNNQIAIITDQSTSTQKAVVRVSDYVGSTRTVTLSSAPAFTIATGDTVAIVAATGTANVTVLPLTGTSIEYQQGTVIPRSIGDASYIEVRSITDSNGDEIDFSLRTIRVYVSTDREYINEVQTLEDGDIERFGTGNSSLKWLPNADTYSTVRTLLWSLRDADDNDKELLKGSIVIKRSAWNV